MQTALELLQQLSVALAAPLLLFQAMVALTQILEHAPRYSLKKDNHLSYSIKNAVVRASLAVYAFISLCLFFIELVLTISR